MSNSETPSLLKRMWQNLTHSGSSQPITIVSGLPRSGTSMMMKMLEAGGIPPLVDNIRTADIDNPNGYFEFERVKKLPAGDTAWLSDARGKVVKVIATLLVHLPAGYDYQVIFMQRAMPEVIASQRKMLERRGEEANNISDEMLTGLFTQHLTEVNRWIENQPSVHRLDVSYNALLDAPQSLIEQLDQFVAQPLNRKAMAAIIDPALYRQRKNNS
jgi:hypothetical protein